MSKMYIKYGTGIAILLVLYFLILKAIGLHEYPVLSAFNGVIIGIGIFMAIKTYKTKKNSQNFKYQKGFQLGLFTGFLATILFSIFLAVYIYHIDGEFALNVLDSFGINHDFGPLMLVFSALLMGFSTSFVLTLAFMQLLKDSWNTHSPSEQNP